MSQFLGEEETPEVVWTITMLFPLTATQCCGLSPVLGLQELEAGVSIRLGCSAGACKKHSRWERGHGTVIVGVSILPVEKHEIGIGLEESCG